MLKPYNIIDFNFNIEKTSSIITLSLLDKSIIEINKVSADEFDTVQDLIVWAIDNITCFTLKSYGLEKHDFNILIQDFAGKHDPVNIANLFKRPTFNITLYLTIKDKKQFQNILSYNINSNTSSNMKTRITEIDAKPLVGSENEIHFKEGQQYEKVQNEIQTLLTLCANYQELFGRSMKNIQTIIKDNPSVKIEEKTSIEYLGKVHGMEKMGKDLTDLLVKDLKEEIQANFSIGEFIKFIKSKSSTKFACRDIDSILNSTTTTATPTTSGYIPITHKEDYAACLVGPITITPGMSYCEFVNENNNTKIKVGVDESTGQREAYDSETQKTITPEELLRRFNAKNECPDPKEKPDKMISLYEMENINNIIYQLQEYLNFRLVGTNCYGNIIQEKEHISILIISTDCITGQNVNLNAWNFVQLIPSPKVKWKDINYGIQLINQNVEIILTALKGKPNKSSSSKM